MQEERKNREYQAYACMRGVSLPQLRPARRREQQPRAEAGSEGSSCNYGGARIHCPNAAGRALGQDSLHASPANAFKPSSRGKNPCKKKSVSVRSSWTPAAGVQRVLVPAACWAQNVWDAQSPDFHGPWIMGHEGCATIHGPPLPSCLRHFMRYVCARVSNTV